MAAEAGGVPAVDGDKCAGTKLWALGNNDALQTEWKREGKES